MPDFKVNCSCGFSGTLRPIIVLDKQLARCYGCDRLYEYLNERVEVAKPKEIPNFASFDDAIKFYEKTKGATTKSTTGKKRASRTRKPAEKDSSKTLQETPNAVPVYKTIHFYLRPGDSWDQLLKDGREEVNYAGPGTLVFCHEHFHDAECNPSCRGMA